MPKRRRALQFWQLATSHKAPVLQQRMRSTRLALPNQTPQGRGPMDHPPSRNYNYHLNIDSQVEGSTANDPRRDRGKSAAADGTRNADTAPWLVALAGGNECRIAVLRK